MDLVPNQKRRLACEQAVYRKFRNMKECCKYCDDYTINHGLDATWSESTIRAYVGAKINISFKRMKILADVLNIQNPIDMDEVYTAPSVRGVGLYWEGTQGNKVRDFDFGRII